MYGSRFQLVSQFVHRFRPHGAGRENVQHVIDDPVALPLRDAAAVRHVVGRGLAYARFLCQPLQGQAVGVHQPLQNGHALHERASFTLAGLNARRRAGVSAG